MKIEANSPQEYIEALPEERKSVVLALRGAILENLPTGFEEQLSYGMLGYVVPHSLYPAGYHCNPKLPLPFINLASQKNFVAVYHSGIYADDTLMEWFVGEFPKHCKYKLDMGKSCIRFKKMDRVPYELIGELATKLTPERWIEIYEQRVKRK